MKRCLTIRTLALGVSLSALVSAQTVDHSSMPGMDHSSMPGMDMSTPMKMSPAEEYLMNLASGTSMNPQSWPMPMRMHKLGSWNLMFMANAFLVDTQQTGPRGGDKLYSPNWFMASGIHSLGSGSVMLQGMFSLDPATMTDRRYPLLFQTGETAFGKPIIDGQHPHNFIMGLGVNYVHSIGTAVAELYYAPVGDPALGPVAYPHRASALELPQAALGHHWQDSTHIADNVVTGAIKYEKVRLEISGFHGAEPGENRWIIETGAMDSYSARFSVAPTKNWMMQVSAGRLTRPESQSVSDVVRATASVQYTRPLPGGSWSSTLVWGRNHDTLSHHNLNSYLAESVIPFRRKNFFTGRAELVDKDELFAGNTDLEARLTATAGSTFRIGAYTAGYTRDINLVSYLQTGLGFNFTVYSLPSAIKPFYGDHPVGANVFLRVRLKASE